MSFTSIPHAHEYWKSCRSLREPPADLDAAEIFILKSRPGTAQDALCKLDVVCAYDGDARCDGLDLAALGQVRAFLQASA